MSRVTRLAMVLSCAIAFAIAFGFARRAGGGAGTAPALRCGRLRRDGRRRDHRRDRRAPGRAVALLEPRDHLGGMVSGGLGWTDYGKKEVIGGYSLEYFERAGKKYGEPIQWHLEPHVAEDVFKEMVKEAGVEVFIGIACARRRASRRKGRGSPGSRLENGATFAGRDLCRRDLRRRPDGAGRGVVHMGPRRRSASSASRSPASAIARRSISSRCGSVRTDDERQADAGDLAGEEGAVRERRQEGAGLQLPRLHDEAAGEPRGVPEARRLRARALRAAGEDARRDGQDQAGGRGRASACAAPCAGGGRRSDVSPEAAVVARGRDEAGSHPERQDRHEQQRRVLDRLHRRQLRLSGGQLRRRARRSGRRTSTTSRASSTSSRTIRGCPRRCTTRWRRGASARTSSPTPATGRISSTSARRAG